jgi:hypothetical protein
MKFIIAPGNVKVPFVDVRESDKDRQIAHRMVKQSNGNRSKYVPEKWGYGPFGPIKY